MLGGSVFECCNSTLTYGTVQSLVPLQLYRNVVDAISPGTVLMVCPIESVRVMLTPGTPVEISM